MTVSTTYPVDRGYQFLLEEVERFSTFTVSLLSEHSLDRSVGWFSCCVLYTSEFSFCLLYHSIHFVDEGTHTARVDTRRLPLLITR